MTLKVGQTQLATSLQKDWLRRWRKVPTFAFEALLCPRSFLQGMNWYSLMSSTILWYQLVNISLDANWISHLRTNYERARIKLLLWVCAVFPNPPRSLFSVDESLIQLLQGLNEWLYQDLLRLRIPDSVSNSYRHSTAAPLSPRFRLDKKILALSNVRLLECSLQELFAAMHRATHCPRNTAPLQPINTD